jgi:hypothetical protein
VNSADRVQDPIISTSRVDEFTAKLASNETPHIHSQHSSTEDFRTAPVTMSEIQDHIWLFSREQNPRGEEERTARSVDGDFTGKSLCVRESRGKKKVTTILRLYSSAEEAASRRVGSRRRPPSPRALQAAESLSQCYSALRYRKFLERGRMVVPDFIDNCDFQQLQAERRAEKARKAAEMAALLGTSRSGDHVAAVEQSGQ